jgi:hypothetical protein
MELRSFVSHFHVSVVAWLVEKGGEGEGGRLAGDSLGSKSGAC